MSPVDCIHDNPQLQCSYTATLLLTVNWTINTWTYCSTLKVSHYSTCTQSEKRASRIKCSWSVLILYKNHYYFIFNVFYTCGSNFVFPTQFNNWFFQCGRIEILIWWRCYRKLSNQLKYSNSSWEGDELIVRLIVFLKTTNRDGGNVMASTVQLQHMSRVDIKPLANIKSLVVDYYCSDFKPHDSLPGKILNVSNTKWKAPPWAENRLDHCCIAIGDSCITCLFRIKVFQNFKVLTGISGCTAALVLG